MKKYFFKVKCTRIPPYIGDVVTPVSIYLTLRDLYPNTILLESSDYHGNTNSMSFVAFDPIADFLVEKDKVIYKFPDSSTQVTPLSEASSLANVLQTFISSIELEKKQLPGFCFRLIWIYFV